MRARLVILVVAILAVAGFAAQNWPAFMQAQTLNFGILQSSAPLGLIMLVLLGIALVAFLISTAFIRTQSLIEARQHTKALDQQRTLADKAEASRFTDLRQHLDTQLREMRQREGIATAEFEKAMVQAQGEIKAQLELMNRTLSVRLGEFEGHLDARLEQRFRNGVPVAVSSDR
jgi:DNA anti-recombination protein RmuC